MTDVRVLGHASNWRRRDAARRGSHHRVKDRMHQDYEAHDQHMEDHYHQDYVASNHHMQESAEHYYQI